jgi:hypothetical protein
VEIGAVGDPGQTPISSPALRRNLNVIDPARGLGNGLVICAHAFEMKLDGLANERLRLLDACTCGTCIASDLSGKRAFPEVRATVSDLSI